MPSREPPQPEHLGRPSKTEDQTRSGRRAEFARAMARSVLGRHYWGEAQSAELEAARQRPKPRRE